MEISKGIKVIRVIIKRGASRHNNRPEAYDVNMLWEEDGAILEGRKNLACHPLDRNRF